VQFGSVGDARAASTLPQARKRVLSGIQPTGALHLGNYFGALRTWVTHQGDYDNYFCVVDLHALTTPAGHDPKALAAQTRQTVATYVACGIDPEVCVYSPVLSLPMTS
jgi:tryptophanyl-tRNA synthetase